MAKRVQKGPPPPAKLPWYPVSQLFFGRNEWRSFISPQSVELALEEGQVKAGRSATNSVVYWRQSEECRITGEQHIRQRQWRDRRHHGSETGTDGPGNHQPRKK